MRHVMTAEQRTELAEFLKETRKRLRLSQPQAAARAGISAPMLYVLERGHKVTPSESTLLKLAKGYGLDAAELLQRAGYESEASQERGEVWNQSAPVASYSVAPYHVTPARALSWNWASPSGLSAHKTGDESDEWAYAGGEGDHARQEAIDMNRVLDWALGAIALDTDYPLSPHLKNAALPLQAKALVVRYYQEHRGRQLLSAAEMQELLRVIHDGEA